MESLHQIFFWVISIFLVVSFFTILILGLNNRVVIYQDKKDFWRVNITMLIGLVLTWLLNLSISGNGFNQFILAWIATPITTIALIILISNSFIMCIKHNESYFVGSLVAIYRCFYILWGLLLIFGFLMGDDKRKRSTSEVVFGMIAAGAVGNGLFRIINGEAVVRNRAILANQH